MIFQATLSNIFHLSKLSIIAGKILACTSRFNMCRHAYLESVTNIHSLSATFLFWKGHNNLAHSLKHQIEEHGDLWVWATFFFISMLFKWILYGLLYDVDKDDQSFSFTCGGYGSNIFRRMIGDTFERTNPYFSSVLIEDTIDYGFERRSLSSNNNGVLIFVSLSPSPCLACACEECLHSTPS